MASRTWDLAGDGLWHVAENWSEDILPTAADDVVIDVDGDVEVTYHADNTVISSLDSEEALTISGGTLTIEGNADINALLSIQGGNTDFNGSSTTQNLALSGGTFSSNSGLIVENSGIWSAQEFGTTAALINQGEFEISGSDKILRATLTNEGTITHENSNIFFYDGTLDNTETGTYELKVGDFSIQRNFTGLFNNSGTLLKTTDGTAVIRANFNNNGGTIDVQEGLLQFQSIPVLIEGGNLEVDSDASLQFALGNRNLTLRDTISGSGDGKVQITSGNIVPDGQATLNLVGGGLEWLGGFITEGGEIINTGKIEVSSDRSKLIRGTLTNKGTLINGNDIIHRNGAITLLNGIIHNTVDGSYEIQSGRLTVGNRGETSDFTNSGTLTKTTGDTATISTNFTNSGGTVDVQEGALRINGSVLIGGSNLEVDSDGSLQFVLGNRNLTLRNTISGSGDGKVQIISGNIVPDGQATLNFTGGGLEWLGGFITEGGEIINAGKIKVSSSGGKQIRGTLTNEGSILHQSGSLSLLNGIIDNTTDGIYELQSGRLAVGNRGETSDFTNSGTLTKTTGDTATISTSFTSNGGTIDVQAGVLELLNANPVLDGGSLEVNRGAVLEFNTPNQDITFRNDVSATGSGTVRFINGNISPEGQVRLNFTDEGGVEWLGGRISNTGELINEGNFTVSGVGKYIDRLLTNEGKILHKNSIISLAGGTLRNAVDKTYEIEAGGFDDWTGKFENYGVFSKTNGTGVTFSSNFSNIDGTVNVQAGSLELNGGQNLFDGGNVEVDSNAVLNIFRGTTTFRNTLGGTGDGTVRLRESTFASDDKATLNFTGGGVEWLSGRFTSGELVNQGNFEISGGGNRIDGIFTNEGTVLHKSGTVFLGGGTVNNASGGTYNFQSGSFAPASIGFVNLTGVFNNSGILTKTTNSSVEIGVQFNNTGNGVVLINDGELYFNRSNYYSQTLGTTRLAGGNLGVAGAIDIQGGTVDGSGQILANVNTSGIFSPGLNQPGEEIGVLTIGGNYNQSATGALKLDIGGLNADEFDRLNISGNSTFDGTLNINFLDGFVPYFGDAFVLGRFGNSDSEVEDLTVNFTGFDDSAVDWNWKPDIKDDQLILTTTKDGLSGTDLEVQSVVPAVTTADLGDEIEITWTVRNIGDTPATANWSDRLYFSSNPNSLSGAKELLVQKADVPNNILQPGEDYTQTATVRLPLAQNIPAGEYYLLVEADAGRDRPETIETNNLKASTALDLTLPPLPDVVVSQIIPPTEAVAGEEIQVRWTLTNNGVGDATGTWTDVVYLSSDDAIGADIEIESFEFTGTIPEGESVERIQTIQLPANVQGEQYVVVRTDVNDDLFEQDSDDNNISISEESITVLQPALPNLRVTKVTPPVNALSNGTTTVNWIVKNVGNAPAAEWYDQVWLSTVPRTELGDDNLPDPTDIYLGQVKNASFLNPGQSYPSSLTVPLPEGINGNYYFLVYSNVYHPGGFTQLPGALVESDRNDNVGFDISTQIDITPPPDLQVTEVQTLPEAFSGQPVSVNWVVSNEGVGTTLQTNDQIFLIDLTTFPAQQQGEDWDPFDASWTDSIYLSDDNILDEDEDTFLGSFSREGALESKENYASSQDVTLPIGVSGDYYLIVKTDSEDDVYEDAFEDNNQNFTATPIQINLTPPPDLGVEILNIPAAVTASRNITISYRVTNDGSTTTPNPFWVDEFYLSTSAELDLDTALRLGARTHVGRLEPTAFYESSMSFTLPDDLSGDYFVFVLTDSQNVVFEIEDAKALLDSQNGSGESDPDEEFNSSPNVASQAVTILSQPADLVVTATTPPTVKAGEATRVEWTVTNEGTGDTAGATWRDQVIASNNDILGDEDDQALATFTHTGLLDVGESYTRNELVTIPATFVGDKHLFVVTDVTDRVYEGSQEENNASAALPVTIPDGLANLAVTEVSTSGTVGRGAEPLTVTWTVRNTGDGKTDATTWYDSVYLSTSPTFDRDSAILLGEVRRTNSLEEGEDYPGQGAFILPADIAGEFFVFVEADSRNQVSQPADASNVTSKAEAIRVVAFQTEDPELPPPQPINPDEVELPADLTVVSVEAPSEGSGGQPLEISWTVRNDGEDTGNRAWFDAVYLSPDPVFDPETDFYLGAVERTGLGKGQDYTVPWSFEVPKSLSGPLYAFVQTDSTNRVNDTDLANNVGFDVNAVQVSPIPPAQIDLVPGTDIAVATTGVAGEAATISYTVTNEGTETISGTWVDTLYLSADDQWDIDDVVLGQVEITESVAGGSSYDGQLATTLPGVLPGDYRVLVRTDVRNNFIETKNGVTAVAEANNLAASTDQIAIDAQVLELDVPVSGELGDRQSVFYRVEVEAGETLRFNFDSDSTAASNTLLLRYGDMPTPSEFDFVARNPFGSDVELVYPNTKAGTYYVQAYGNQVPGGTASYSLTADVLDFSLSDIGTDSGSNKGQATLTLKGAKFTPDTTAKIIAADGTERAATDPIWKDDTEIWATFDLQGLTTGQYDVVIADGENQAALDDSFTVNNGPVGNLQVKVVAPQAIRPGQSGTIQVVYTNTGETDIVAPVLAIDADNAELAEQKRSIIQSSNGQVLISSFGLSDSDFSEEPIQFLGTNPDGPAGILTPGATGTKIYNFRPTADANIEFTASALEDDIAIDWAAFKDELKPLGYSDAAWDLVYNNFVAEVGSDTDDFQALLAENATYLAAIGEPTSNISELVAAELQQASQYQALNQQLRTGSLGQGQSFIGDVQTVVDEDGDVVIDYNGLLRLFERQANGSYQAQTGDNGVLTQSGSSYQLRELDGTVITFRGDGRIATVKDTNNNQITFVYANNRLDRLDFSTGDFIQYTYNGFGRIETATDQANVQTSFGYDPTGQFLTSVTTPAGTTEYEYENGLLARVTDATGVSAEFAYDAQGRVVSQNLTNGESTLNYAYNSTGGVTVTDENGLQTELIVNARGQVTQVTDPLGNTAQLQYDNAGNLVGLRGPDSANLDYGYDGLGNLTRQTNPLGDDIKFTYDPQFNRLASVTDENGNTIRYSYDNRGNLEAITYPDNSVERFTPDAQGNIERYINRRNTPVDYEYNDRGQVTRIDFQNGDFIRYEYDAQGKLELAFEQKDGTPLTTSFEYDPDTNFLKRIAYPNGRFLDYEFDAAGRRTRLADQDNNVVNYEYDAAGRLEELTDENNDRIVQYQYDDLGRLKRENKGNGTFTTYGYEDANRLEELVHHAPDGSVNSSFEYTYNDLGLQKVVKTLDGDWTYEYDALGQLTGAMFASTNPAIPSQDITYEYDAAGNRRRTIVDDETTNYAANDLNQYTSAGNTVYDYDDDGNLVSKVVSTPEGDQEWSFGYDDLNRLVSVKEPDGTLTKYVYDALGNRVASIRNGERTEYLIDPAGLGNVVAEYDNAGDLVAAYSHGIGLESRIGASNESSYYDFDYIGSTTGLTGADGNYLNRYAYRPFGDDFYETDEAISNPFEYVGQWGIMEEANAFDFMRARFYDSSVGRFISVDPAGISSGEDNFYSYAFNDPISFSDPLGLWTVSYGWTVGGGAGGGGAFDIELVWDRTTPWDDPRVQITFKGGGFGGAGGGGGVTASFTNADTAQDLTGLGVEYGGSGGELGVLGAGIPLALSNGQIKGGGLSLFAGVGGGTPVELHLFASQTVDIGSFKELTGRSLFDFIGSLPVGLLLKIFGNDDSTPIKNNDDFAPVDSSTTGVNRPVDPNDIVGPSGFGDENWLTADTPLPYTIRFENQSSATASAQEVIITHPLDPDLDWRTFRLGSFGWGGITFEVPENRSFYQERIDLTEDYGFYVDVVARIDVINGVATWTLTTIDPETGQKTNDALVGFLPPNDEEGSGDGFVTYTIRPDADVETGAVIDAEATIVFDTEAPIDTPPIFNTLDAGTPTSTMSVLPTISTTPEFLVSWSGTDDENGSGIADYTIYVSENGGEFTPWLENTTLTEATYLGQDGNTYEFYVAAIDNAGNQEALPISAQAITTVEEDSAEPPIGFDADDYLASHPDLIEAFGYDLAAATQHYQNFGQAEGRALDLFPEYQYLASHPDLILGFGNDTVAATRHYIEEGYAAGLAIDNFPEEQYLASYEDLQVAFGDDLDAATLHYIEYGFAQGRDPLLGFDGGAYIASYRDLINAFRYDPDAGKEHYRQWGYQEGRTVTFEADEYLASHSDLIQAFGYDLTAATEHYILYGITEGRSQDLFDGEAYLNRYADLKAAFGNDLDAAAKHYIQYGFAEGRTWF